MLAGAAGAALAPGFLSFAARADIAALRSRVSFVTGTGRRQMAYDALKPFREQIRTAISGKQVILKANNVSVGYPACATHVDTLRGLLDFFKEMTTQQIQIAEAPASYQGATATFQEYGYAPLATEYNVKLVDWNTSTYSEIDGIQTLYRGILKMRIIEPLTNSANFIVSVARMKTHWTAVATLSVKNILMCAPWNGNSTAQSNQVERMKMHGGQWWDSVNNNNDFSNRYLTLNMPTVAKYAWPDLAFVDGYEGMEGDGPERGTPVASRIALAGFDPVAVDRIGTELMGINPFYMQYVKKCADLGLGNWDCSLIDVLGPPIGSYIKKYAMAPSFAKQVAWMGAAQPSVCNYTTVSIRSMSPEQRGSIPIVMPRTTYSRISVTDLQGRPVRTLVAHTIPEGRHTITWDHCDDSGHRVPAGIYIMRIQSRAGDVRQRITVGW